jgi:hypothetical protein
MSANDRQVSGKHYHTEIQPWDFIIANNLGWCEGNIIKYVSRHKEKNGVEDLKKAQHYLEKLIEVTLNASLEQEKSASTETKRREQDYECHPFGQRV